MVKFFYQHLDNCDAEIICVKFLVVEILPADVRIDRALVTVISFLI